MKQGKTFRSIFFSLDRINICPSVTANTLEAQLLFMAKNDLRKHAMSGYVA